MLANNTSGGEMDRVVEEQLPASALVQNDQENNLQQSLLSSSADHDSDVGPDPSLWGAPYVTLAAIFFGLGGMLVKLSKMDVLVLIQLQALVYWCISFTVLFAHSKRSSDKFEDVLFGPRELRPYLRARALCYWLFLLAWWYAVKALALGDATAIVYACPILSALLARIFLKEPLFPTFPVNAALCVAGVALISQPSFIFGSLLKEQQAHQSSFGIMCALLAVLAGAVLPLLVRKSKIAHWATVEHFASSHSAFLFTPSALLVRYCIYGSLEWSSICVQQVCIIVSSAFLNYLGLGLQTRGYQLETASKASIMTYIEIPFNYLNQALVFHDPVSKLAVGGTFCILVSCVLNAYKKYTSALS